jgi:RNA polymerase sigma-70 factor (ECF subfamily)
VVSADRTEAVLTDVLTSTAPDLLRYLERRLDPHDAADALGDVLLAAWRRVADLPETGHEARLWLFGIARHTVSTTRRGRSRRDGLAERVHREPAPAGEPGADRGVEVRDAIDRLEPDLAELVRLVHWDGFALADAARVLDLPASTVRSRYRRARDLLRAELADDPAPDGVRVARRGPEAQPRRERSAGSPTLRVVGPV